jgi:hypothetical protein
MFSLSESDLDKIILGCGDGPACFNAELSKIGGNITWPFALKDLKKGLLDDDKFV